MLLRPWTALGKRGSKLLLLLRSCVRRPASGAARALYALFSTYRVVWLALLAPLRVWKEGELVGPWPAGRDASPGERERFLFNVLWGVLLLYCAITATVLPCTVTLYCHFTVVHCAVLCLRGGLGTREEETVGGARQPVDSAWELRRLRRPGERGAEGEPTWVG
eukprot:scaffold5561_cov131-Isochrysis_galbana.AAC.4